MNARIKNRGFVLTGSALALLVLMVFSCGTPSKIDNVRSKEMKATLALSRDEIVEERRIIESKRDTITIEDENGAQMLVMHAIRDEESGDMVATEELDAAVITARFRNVAERNGKIDLRFEVIVPAAMQDSRWQLRFYPDMFIMEDSLRLEPVIITGNEYRRKQIRGYQQYEKFIKTIVTDTTLLTDFRNLHIFIKRNLPEIAKYRNDTTFVTDEEFRSHYGVTEREAIEHYQLKNALKRNRKRISRKEKMWMKYVKVPIVTEGIRLDTVMTTFDGDFVYHYTQTINTRPKLRKVDIYLSGEIYEGEQKLYNMSRSEPLTFYISSLSSFVDGTEKYKTKVIERRAAANTACNIDFRTGKYDIDLSLGDNEKEMGRIRGYILDLLHNEHYDLDSIVVAASASPEGSLSSNNRLSEKRAASVADHFDRMVRHYRDSVQRALNEEAANSFTMVIGEDGSEKVARAKAEKADIPEIRFLSRSNGENWPMLSLLMDEDTVLSRDAVNSFVKYLEIADVDAREKSMRKEPYYKYMKEKLYPKLRTVRFDMYLHKKGMVKDTVHTTELDSVYMKGIELLREREYEKALVYLRDYRDYNTAIAYVSLDYNASAMAILQELDRTPEVNYMLAVLYARQGDDQKAVQHYMDACKQEHSYVFRGNPDPEIYVLIQRYGLNKQDDDDLIY